MALSPLNGGSRAGDYFVTMRRDLLDLQRQLTTGQRAATYGGLGFERRTSLDVRARLSALEGYTAAVDGADLRLKMMVQNLERLDALGQDTKSDATLARFELLSDGRTFSQMNAEQRLKEAIDLLNSDVAGRSLFAGRAVDTLPVESFERIMNGDGTRAGVKQLIAERKAADLGPSGLGRLALSHAAGATTLSLSEDANASVRANFGFSILGAQGTASGTVAAAMTAEVPAAATLSFATAPREGEVVRVTLDRPDGRQESLDFVARAAPRPDAVPPEFAIGGSAAAAAGNLAAAVGPGEIAGVWSNPPTGLDVAFAGGSPARVDLSVAGQPKPGETIRVTLGLKDGSTAVVELTAKASGDPTKDFVIGATLADTADSLSAALGAAVTQTAAGTLAGTSALMASADFFAGSLADPFEPRRVVGSPATGFSEGPTGTTLAWYKGDRDPSVSARNTAPVRSDQTQVVATGARANEAGIANVLSQLAALSAETFTTGDRADVERFTALSQGVFDRLSDTSENPKVTETASELATAAATLAAAKERHRATESMLLDALDGAEGVSKEEAAAAILDLQNRLQASYETTSILSRLSLVNYL
jgi:flagellar hook-associated protein 3 FlgL